MLLRFGVVNYRSFRDFAELSFVSTAGQEEPSYRLDFDGTKYGVLPVVGVWGANASGKSTLLNALMHMRGHVKNSFIALGPDERMPHEPWALGPEREPTSFELDLVVDGVHHHYGFSHDATGVLKEWLYYWPAKHRVRLFERERGEAGDEYKWGLRGKKKFLSDSTRRNSLFLSCAAQHGHKQLTPVFRKIVQGINKASTWTRGHPVFTNNSEILKESNSRTFAALLAAADLGITNIEHRPVEHPLELLKDSPLRPEIVDQLRERWQASEDVELVFGHRSEQDTVMLDPRNESGGTHSLTVKLDDVFSALNNGTVLVADEIETSLHPDVCVELISLFTSRRSNPKGAQLLFTSHSRELLDELRRDEVVLVDKGQEGASSLRPLVAFRGLKPDALFRRMHRRGEMGGVPLLHSFVDAATESEEVDASEE